MDNQILNLKTVHAKNALADARIAQSLFAYILLVTGIVCLLTSSSIEWQVIFEIWAARRRDHMGELSFMSATIVALQTIGTLLSVLVLVHWVFDVIPRRVWTSPGMILFCVVILAILVQQVLLDYKDIAEARLPLDAEPGAALEANLAIAEWQGWGRLPFYLAAIVAAGFGMLLIKHNVRHLLYIRRLKAVRRKTQDVAERYNALHFSGLNRDRAASKRRSSISEAFTKELWRRVCNQADELNAYLRGPNLGRSVDTSLAEALRSDEPPVSPLIQELARNHAPAAVDLTKLPTDSTSLAPQTRKALQDYANWLLETYHPTRVRKEIL